jgi:tetratricopeptide (TPR) repeat protein
MEISSIFEKINKFSLLLLVFLLPIFFLPFTQNFLDFPKKTLFLILVSISFFAWFGKSAFKGKLLLKKANSFYIIIFLLFLSFLISFSFSPSPYFSFFGSQREVTDSFLTFLLFLIFSFLLINSFQEKAEIFLLAFSFLLGSSFSAFFNLFQIFGIFIFPFDFSKSTSFNLIGTPNSLAIFSAILLPLSLILFFKSQSFSLKFTLGFASLIFFLNILFVNSSLAWTILFIEVLFLFVFGIKRERINFGFNLILMFLLISSLFFYFFPLRLSIFPTLPPEVSLSLPAEIYVLKGSFSDSLKNLFFGTGPANFSFSYSRYRSPLLNQTPFWGTRFQKGFSTFFDWILTKGIVGGFFLFLFLLFSFLLIFRIIKEKKDPFSEINLAVSCALLGSIFSFLLYPLNFSLLFLFWSLVSVVVFLAFSNQISINVIPPQRSVLFNLTFVLSLIFAFSLIFLQTKIYLAEVYYLKGITEFQKGNLDNSVTFLEKAVRFSPRSDSFWRDLSQVYLAKATALAQTQNLEKEERSKLTNRMIGRGAEAINKAVLLLPFNPANWNVRGFFYRNLIGVEGADSLSLSSYQKAIELEPNSPYPWTEKGRVYILAAQSLPQDKKKEKEEKLKRAVENLKEALSLKPDYPLAHYLLAVAFDQLGQKEKAISELETTKKLVPQDWGITFQLGLLYWRKENFKKAKEEFERAIALNPKYFDAKFMLAVTYDALGQKEKAKEILKDLQKKDPENQDIKKALENIEKGLPILEAKKVTEPMRLEKSNSEIKK